MFKNLISTPALKSWRAYLSVGLVCLIGYAASVPAHVPVVSSHSALSVEILPVADGYVLDQSPFDGIGDAVEAAQGVTVFFNAGVAEARGVMEFDLDAIGSGSRIQSAHLKLVPIGGGVLPGTLTVPIQLSGFTGDGSIQTADFNAGAALTVFDGLHVPAFLDVTEFLQNRHRLGFVGFSLRTNVHGAQINFGSLELGSPAALVVELNPIPIDIKPDSFPNSINPGSRGTIPVAILSDSTFDATSLDRTSLTFGRTGDEPSLAFCNSSLEDVNGDGLLDRVCHFKTQSAGFQSGDTAGVLKGRTLTGIPISGTDSVRLVP